MNAMALKPSENIQKDTDEYSTKRGLFGWEQIGLVQVPYIVRKINGKDVMYIAVRIAENQLLQKYLKFFHQDMYSYSTCVKSYSILELEAKILDEINVMHCDDAYGKEPFYVGKDYIVLLEDVKEFYAFLETCYKKLLHTNIRRGTENCGFIRINSEAVVSYCIKNNHKYIPLFYFEGDMDYLRHCAIKVENWNLAYLKFCFMIQGIRTELFSGDSCTVISLDVIKNYYPPDTVFEEFWPDKVDTKCLINANTANLNTSGSWIRKPNPSENPAIEAAIVQTPTTLPPPPPPGIPIIWL